MHPHLAYFRHFGAIGFPIATQIEFERLLKMAFEWGHSLPLTTGNGKYVVWEPGAGVQIWVKVKDRVVLGCSPHYAGEGALQAEVQGFYTRPEEIAVTDGALVGTALPQDPESACFPLVVDVPGFEATASRVAPGQTAMIQGAAFAREMQCFADPEAFSRATREAAAASLVFPGLPEAATAPTAPAPAEARMTARVLKAERRINPITQQSFIALVVQIPGGSTVDVVSNTQDASGELQVGGIVQGSFWLSGHVLDTVSPADTVQRSAPSKSPVLSRLTGWVRGGS